MNWTLEVVMVPVTDVDRAIAFYRDQLGFHLDHDTRGPDGSGPVQLTPPGSGCSIEIGHGLSPMAPGSLQGLQLVVADLPAARDTLRERGVDVGPIQVVGPTGLHEAKDGDDLDNVGFVFLTDPDGNGWGVQQISSRVRGRHSHAASCRKPVRPRQVASAAGDGCTVPNPSGTHSTSEAAPALVARQRGHQHPPRARRHRGVARSIRPAAIPLLATGRC